VAEGGRLSSRTLCWHACCQAPKQAGKRRSICFVCDVQDGGRGIAALHHAAVLDEFVRIDDSESGSPPGAGLGLYIGRRLAESMGGELVLVREGALFSRLPARTRLDSIPSSACHAPSYLSKG